MSDNRRATPAPTTDEKSLGAMSAFEKWRLYNALKA